MLTELFVRNIVLIEQLDLNFSQKLTALTGETGAGKSILLDALGLALGGRGDASLVRGGETEGQVTAVFELQPRPPLQQLLDEHDIEFEDQLILRRIQKADGKTKAFVNDQPVTKQLLSRIGAMLVEIHGQHETRALMDPESYRSILDNYGSLQSLAAKTAQKWDSYQKHKQALEQHERDIASIQERAGYLSHALEELNELSPQEGEEEELVARRQLMMSAEKVIKDFDLAANALSPTGGLQSLISAHGRIGAQIEKNEQAANLFEPVFQAINRVLIEADEALSAVHAAARESQFDPKELDATEERLFALRGLARKHKIPVAMLPEIYAKISAELEALDAGEQHIEELRVKVEESWQGYLETARQLHEKRKKAAASLDRKILKEFAPLKLEKAKFFTRVDALEEGQGGRFGTDRVTFEVQTNPGTPPGPLGKIASGGELSRFMLALKVVLAEKVSAPTLIFDEIDAGVGGATATAIGARLAQLGQNVQVLCVTHAPQVAAQAQAHLHISKSETKAARKKQAGETPSVQTSIRQLSSQQRREELARMLSGARVTDEARAAADQLLNLQK